MSISRVNGPGWGIGDKLTSAQANGLDLNTTYAIDKRSGQTDTLESVVSCTGSGRVVPSFLTGADSDQTYALSAGISVINATAITAPRAYTISTTGAMSGDRVVIYGGAQPLTVKDGFDSSTLLIVGTGSTAQLAEATVTFNGTRWLLPQGYGAGAAAFFATPSSANLATLMTDETGTGALVFASSPTLAGTVVHNGTGVTTTNNAKGTCLDNNPVNVQTTDATVTNLDTFTLASNTGVHVSWMVMAVKSDMTQGAGYVVTAVFRNNAGTVAQVGTTQVTSLEDASTWDVTADNSTTTIRLRVTGVAATTIQWTAIRTSLASSSPAAAYSPTT